MATRVQLFVTCLAEQFFPAVLEKMVGLLERLDVQVAFPQEQTCCGQPFFNSGFQSHARSLARRWLEVFGRTDGYIVSPSGSCVNMVRHHYPQLFADGTREHALALDVAARTFEFSQFLVHKLDVTDDASSRIGRNGTLFSRRREDASDVGARFRRKVTYHASCHLLRGLGVRDEPKQLLRALQDLELVPLAEEETCCGFGGVFSMIYPEVSQAMLQAKICNIAASGADVVVACDPGCLMNIRGGLYRAGWRVKAMHLIEVLADSEIG